MIVYANPLFGPVKLIKIDLVDGYYWVPLSAQGALQLVVVLPFSFANTLIAIPLTLPMGWAESLPYFCMCTETIMDITNQQLSMHSPAPPIPHHQEHLANSIISLGNLGATFHSLIPPHHQLQHLIAQTDVYLDDFISMAQTFMNETKL